MVSLPAKPCNYHATKHRTAEHRFPYLATVQYCNCNCSANQDNDAARWNFFAAKMLRPLSPALKPTDNPLRVRQGHYGADGGGALWAASVLMPKVRTNKVLESKINCWLRVLYVHFATPRGKPRKQLVRKLQDTQNLCTCELWTD